MKKRNSIPNKEDIVSDVCDTLRKNLRFFRRLNNYTQQDLGRILKCNYQLVGHHETGYCRPTIEILIQLSKLYGVSIDDLILKDLTSRKY